MAYKILNTVGENYAAEAREVLESVGKVGYLTLSQEKLKETIGEYDIAVVALGLNFDRDILSRAKKLKIIATATTGLDHIDLEAAGESGIEVLSLRGENEFLNTITGTAELAWGLIIDLLRQTPWAYEAVKKYEWRRENFHGHNLFGKTLAVVGLGRLGRRVARYGLAFGMRVLFYDPYVELEKAADLVSPGNKQGILNGVRPILQKADFGTLLKESDIVSIHVHLNKKTENMFGAAVFAQMKPTAYLINTSRGKIVNESDLLDALKNKKLAGYATDVLAGELEFETKGFSGHPLVEYAKEHRNCIIVPHIGGMTEESRIATDVFMAEKLTRALKIKNLV